MGSPLWGCYPEGTESPGAIPALSGPSSGLVPLWGGPRTIRTKGNPSLSSSNAPVLVVDDEVALRHLLRLILSRAGHEVVEAGDGSEALLCLGARPDLRVVLCDLRMPRMDGLQFLAAAREQFPQVRVVLMSAYGASDTAVEALSQGAVDYVDKPFRADEVLHCVARILEREALVEENARLRARVHEETGLSGFVGRSDAARGVMALVERVANYPSTVLITGESGTGKELLARALHERSDRAARPFVPLNCAAIPEGLLESELFGHERGAFTGAVRARAGLFEQAHGGTLLLDEIGDMPAVLQTRLLRVLEDGRVRRVGGDRDREVDVRVVAATAVDLERQVTAGRFRADLFYRLNVVRVRIPPLRERKEDLPLLCQVLLQRAAARLGQRVRGLSPEAARELLGRSWPGNVRELENVLEQALLLARGDRVEAQDLPIGAAASTAAVGIVSFLPDDGKGSLSIKAQSAQLEAHLIRLALARTGGNRSSAARLLELSTKALAYKIREYGLAIDDGGGDADG
jgi:two-component system response regulator AtoC